MEKKETRASEKKKRIVAELEKLLVEYPVIAAINMENMPAPQLQQMRAKLVDRIYLKMAKKRLIRIALNNVKNKKKNIEKLAEYLRGMPALIFTKENPFSLFKLLKKNKTNAPAKPNQLAPTDIKVQKGPTGFAPGPIIGELAQIGIKAGVENGKVVIKEDSIVVKEGEKISAKLAEILTRLGIEPMEIGLNINAIYENETIYTKDILDIDEDKFRKDLEDAARFAYYLAIDIAYPTKGTIERLIIDAFNNAKLLGISQKIIDDEVINELLCEAEKSALSIKDTAKIEIPEKHKRDEEKPEKKEVAKEPEKRNEKSDTEKKIEKMVEETKKFVKGEVPSADKLIEEASKLSAKEIPKEDKKKKEDVPSAHQLKEKIEKKKKEQKEIEKLTQELIKKGTLRKS